MPTELRNLRHWQRISPSIADAEPLHRDERDQRRVRASLPSRQVLSLSVSMVARFSLLLERRQRGTPEIVELREPVVVHAREGRLRYRTESVNIGLAGAFGALAFGR